MATLGLDLSLNSPGVAIRDPEGQIHYYFAAQRDTDTGVTHPQFTCWGRMPTTRYAKCRWIRERLLTVIRHHDVRHVIMEGHAFGTRASKAKLILMELGGIIRCALDHARVRVTEFSPRTVKKNFTGNGTASKMDMLLNFERQTGLDLCALFVKYPNDKQDIPCPLQDIVDAHALLAPYWKDVEAEQRRQKRAEKHARLQVRKRPRVTAPQ